MVLMFHLSDFAISNDFFMTKVMEFPTFLRKHLLKLLASLTYKVKMRFFYGDFCPLYLNFVMAYSPSS